MLALRNSGVYEPEFRLLVMVPAFIATGVGGFGLGMSISQGMSIWICAVFLGILNFAVGVGCTGIITYTNDVCRENAGNAFGITMFED
ncbi:unnamed protein product [Clonostachys rosea]|uniref:Major facilitator superfamily (MFS) profile domain-containing protein n=1 Tax=Bionectria ochroleuca TaxID=29856 RepID=A0ABY6UKA5_BIOOC|nr:unnamed protein product [Clonostachys rosea]